MNFAAQGEDPNFNPTQSCAAVITINQSELLLQKRDEKPSIFFSGFTGLFGGGVEADESPRDAIVREIEEELSIVLHPDRFEPLADIDFRCQYLSSGKLRSRHFFYLDLRSEEAKRIRLREGQRVETYTLSKLPPMKTVVPTDLMPLMMYVAMRNGEPIDPVV